MNTRIVNERGPHMQGEPKQKRRYTLLTRMQVAFLVFVMSGAIISMLAAPEGAVSGMVLQAAGKMAGDTNLSIHAKPQPLKDLGFLDDTGKKKQFSDYRGQVTIVSIWALWCPACKAEKPGLNQLAAQFEGKGLKVLTLSSDDPEQAQNYLKNHQLSHLKAFTDVNDDVYDALDFDGIPAAIIIDKQGREVARSLGFVDWQDKDVVRFVETLIRSQPETRAER